MKRRSLEEHLRTCTTQQERQRLLMQAGTQMLRAANRRAKPRPPKREDSAPTTPRARGYCALGDLSKKKALGV